MPFKMPAHLRAQLHALEAQKREVKEAARAVARERAPLLKAVRDIERNLERTQASRHRMIFGNGVCIQTDERTAERIHGQQWRENAARIKALESELLTAQLRLAFHDQEHDTWQ